MKIASLNKLIPPAFLAVLIIASCNEDQTSTFDERAERKILRVLKEVEWPKAYRDQDTVLLDRILGDDFQMVGNDGTWSDKAGQMARIKAAPMDNDSFRFEIKRLDVFPNGTAIVGGTGHVYRDTTYTIYQSSNVLIKRDSLWKAVLSHVSGVKQIEN